ncbi:MAG TPA: hypothetical protein VFH21_05605 [Burkholderiales bacterium]|nr:hypothetical protein [Burkholderiales bacterium]
MTQDTLLPVLLVAQGVMGAVDTLVNHELIERLPHRSEARTEIGLHSIREAVYATLFGGLAWFAWHGALAAVIGVLLVSEVLVTACDEFIENHTRVVPQNERVLHVFLTLNLGLLIAVVMPTLLSWAARPTALIPISHGMLSWALSALAIAALVWSLRDLLAWRRLSRYRS